MIWLCVPENLIISERGKNNKRRAFSTAATTKARIREVERLVVGISRFETSKT
jgi:hypothetical protein